MRLANVRSWPKRTGSFVALLRAVNVARHRQMPMTELKAICEELGFTSVRTYIASGNVGVRQPQIRSASQARAWRSDCRLSRQGSRLMRAQRRRDGAGLRRQSLPEASAQPHPWRSLNEAPPKDTRRGRTRTEGREDQLGKREIYVHYGEGMGRSKHEFPREERHARNINGRDLTNAWRRDLIKPPNSPSDSRSSNGQIEEVA